MSDVQPPDRTCQGCGCASDAELCPRCDSDLLAHIDALAAQEPLILDGNEIMIEEQLRKNHNV